MENLELKKSLRLLLVEDSPSDAALMEETILAASAWDIYLSVANSLASASEHLKNNGSTDAVLLDLSLPDSAGIESVIRLKEISPDIPIVVLTGMDDERLGLQALRCGAQDYLVKGQVDGRFILRSVDYAIERRNAELMIRSSEQRLRMSLQAGRGGAWEWDLKTNLGWFSPEVYDLCGIKKDLALNADNLLAIVDHRDAAQLQYVFKNAIILGNTSLRYEFRIVHPHYGITWLMICANIIYDVNKQPLYIIGIVLDVNERKSTEFEHEVTLDLVKIINECTSSDELIRSALKFFQKQSSCQAVGIRLKDGFDYPYHSVKGFPAEFVEQENILYSRDLLGQVVVDKNDFPRLDCLCGIVISGKSTSSKPFFTEAGSFWTNSLSKLDLQNRTDLPPANYRFRCCKNGYESVALLPLKLGHDKIGLLQLNDKRPDLFTIEQINLWERLLERLAAAVSKLRADEDLKKGREDLNRAQSVAHIGSWQFDMRNNNNLIWSDETYNIFGIPKNTLITYEKFLVSVYPHDRNYVDMKWKAALRGEAYDIEHRIVANGNTKWVRGKAHLEYDKSGAVIECFGTIQDITELKRVQELLQQTNLELENRVKERTSQLEKLVDVLQKEITERVKAEKQIIDNQEKLRALASELIVVEERERRQVATQLHDSIGQLLAFSKKELGALLLNVDGSVKTSIQEVWELIKQAVQETRTLTFDLSPSTLYQIGFDAAVEELAEDFSKKGKFVYNYSCDLPPKTFPEQDKILFYRSIRELLINISKHSQAKNVDIDIKKLNNKIQITVKDDGVGFDVGSLNGKNGKEGFGLFSIRERLEALGGNLKIQSVIGNGTAVTLSAPLDLKKQRKG